MQQEQQITEGRHPEESIATENNVNGSAKVNSPVGNSILSPASTVQTAKSNASGKRRRGKPGIKFLKRAISSPPILLQRFHSNLIEKDRETFDGSCQENINSNRNRNRLPHAGSCSSSSKGSIELNPNRTNANMAELTKVVPKFFSSISKKEKPESKVDRKDDESESTAVKKAHCTATSILHHSCQPVLESLCGVPQSNTIHDTQPDENKRSILFPPADNNKDDLQHRYYTQRPGDASCLSIPEDPTVQESIECIFASQLEDGLKLWDEEYDDEDEDHHSTKSNSNFDDRIHPRGHRSFETLEKVWSSSSSRDGLISPAAVQQSRMNRKDRKGSTKALFANMPQTKKRYEQASLVYVGTFDPSTPKNNNNNNALRNTSIDGSLDASTFYPELPTDPLPCRCATSFLPSVEPRDWPQAPIALRPTPGSSTRVKAIRFSNSIEPLWVPGSHLNWAQILEQHWGRQTDEEQRRKRDQLPHYACCEKCVILPINNGNEAPGESLVIDFESDLFEGSFLLRLRYAEGTTPQPYDDNRGYFKGMNRRYQACVRGRFKTVMPFTELTTGFKLGRKFGKLPSKWVLKGALKVVSFFAPQLDIDLEGATQPYSVTPLGSTPQCINVDDEDECYGHWIHARKETNGCSTSSDEDQLPKPCSDAIEDSNAHMNPLDGVRVESSEARRSILGISGEDTTSLQRAKIRKKAFEKLYTQKSQHPKTDPSKIYTFEFLQHMFNFQDFSIELGNMLGSVKLEEMLDGQPLPIMASHGDKYLWSFDVWNECLWEQAKKHDAIEKQQQRRPASP